MAIDACTRVTVVVKTGGKYMAELNVVEEGQSLHLRVEGKTEDLGLEELGLSVHSTDTEVRRAVAGRFNKPTNYFDGHTVERSDVGISMRPAAVFGS